MTTPVPSTIAITTTTAAGTTTPALVNYYYKGVFVDYSKEYPPFDRLDRVNKSTIKKAYAKNVSVLNITYLGLVLK